LFAGVSWFGATLAGPSSPVPPTWRRCGRDADVADVVVLYLSIVNVGQAWYAFGWDRCCWKPAS